MRLIDENGEAGTRHLGIWRYKTISDDVVDGSWAIRNCR